ncbi:MFS transporter [bacterium]|nr:MFS transporter [bacterium]
MSSPIKRYLRSVFQNRNLSLLWAGQVVSMSGDSIYQIALLWLALELTASKAITGLVAMSSYLPTILLALVAGVVADRANRRRVMLIADAVRAIAIFGIPLASLLGFLSPWVLVINAFVIASAAAFFNPAKDAIIPQLVPPSGLLRANSLIQTSWQLALLMGPAIAGGLLTLMGLIPLFAFDAGAYFLSFVTIWLLRPKPERSINPACSSVVGTDRHPGDILSSKCPEDEGTLGGASVPGQSGPATAESATAGGIPPHATPRSPWIVRVREGWTDIRQGLSYTAKQPVILPLLLITVADNLFIMGPAIVGMPVLIRETFAGSASDYALMAMAFAVGMLLGTVGLVLWGGKIPKGKMLLWGMVFDGFTFVPYFFAQTLTQLGVLSVIHGMAVPLLTVSRASLIQEVVPANMRGRIFSLISLAVVGMSAISSGLTGLILELIPAPLLFLIIGTVGGLCGVIGLLFAKQLRKQL